MCDVINADKKQMYNVLVHKILIYILVPVGGRPGDCSSYPYCCPGEGCGDDQTLHADRHQYSPEERHLRRGWLL